MAIYQLNDLIPRLHDSVYVAPGAQVIGNVCLARDVSVWFGSVLRGDSEAIRVGAGCNIQDLCVLHADAGIPLTLGDGVTVGHQAMLHGCHVGNGSLIGIQAVVLNKAVIGKNCLVAAGSVVTEGAEFPDGALILGAPAKLVRLLTPEQVSKLHEVAKHYQNNGLRFARGLKKLRD